MDQSRLFFRPSFQIFKSQCQTMCNLRPSKDLIGPPDPISNLRFIKYAVREKETPTEKELRKHREELQDWNKIFWTKHNLHFIQRKKEFEASHRRSDKETLSADEMSVFYKEFLDQNWKMHMKYLLEWYKRHAFVTFLHFKVVVEKLFRKGS